MLEYCCPRCKDALRTEGVALRCAKCGQQGTVLAPNLVNFLDEEDAGARSVLAWPDGFVREVAPRLRAPGSDQPLSDAIRDEMVAHGVLASDGEATPLAMRITYNDNEYMWQSAYDPIEGLADLAAPGGGLRVLDVGCGAGQTLRHLRSRSVSLLAGVDVQLQSLAYGSRLASLEGIPISLAGASAYRLPFPDTSMDFLIMRASLNYVHQTTALAEAVRVLTLGGHLFCRFECFWWDVNVLRSQKSVYSLVCRLRDLAVGITLGLTGWQPKPDGPLRWGRSFATVANLRYQLDRLGCDVVRVESSRHGPQFRGRSTQLLLLARRRPGP